MANKKKHIFSVNAIRDKMNYTNKPTYKRLGEFMNDGYDTLSKAELISLRSIIDKDTDGLINTIDCLIVEKTGK